MVGDVGGPVVMIEAQAPPEAIRRAYDLWSRFYGWVGVPLERKARMIGLDEAAVRPGEKVLEVAVGPGATFVEILRRVGPGGEAVGVDLSPRMLDRTRRRALRAGWREVGVQEADARRLPFPDGAFDVLFNSYMLDLIPLGEMPAVLGEFLRVLKPGGRLALVNFSKRAAGRRTLWERFYQALPRRWVPYVAGGCRPVVMAGAVERAGFRDLKRQFVPGLIPSEVVLARKPGG
ncbi:MAG TPA: methyltransferase domain-containing protein [Anaeromyxobacteraceae bacterium]|nr:methyltransferase domain-containing protein [Anaeromyxobacteraceae bacterium]